MTGVRERDAGARDAERLGVRRASRRPQQTVEALELAAVGGIEREGAAALHGAQLRVQRHLDALALQLLGERRTEHVVEAAQQRVAAHVHAHVRPQRVQYRGELAAT